MLFQSAPDSHFYFYRPHLMAWNAIGKLYHRNDMFQHSLYLFSDFPDHKQENGHNHAKEDIDRYRYVIGEMLQF